jgi:hypothetical protein
MREADRTRRVDQMKAGRVNRHDASGALPGQGRGMRPAGPHDNVIPGSGVSLKSSAPIGER